MRNILFLDAHGVGLAVHSTSLLAGNVAYSPGSHNLATIILTGEAAVTTAALRWLAREHVGLLVAHDGSSSVSVVTDSLAARTSRAEIGARLKQMACVLDPARRLEAARA